MKENVRSASVLLFLNAGSLEEFCSCGHSVSLNIRAIPRWQEPSPIKIHNEIGKKRPLVINVLPPDFEPTTYHDTPFQDRPFGECANVYAKAIVNIDPDVLVIGQTPVAEEVLVRSYALSANCIVVRYSQRKAEEGGYLPRGLDELPYHFDCPKDPALLWQFLLEEDLREPFSNREHAALHAAIGRFPESHPIRKITYLKSPAFDAHLAPSVMFLRNPVAAFDGWNLAGKTPAWWRETHFDVAIVEDRAVVRLHGYWNDRTPASSSLGVVLAELERRKITRCLLDVRRAKCIGPILTMPIYAGPLAHLNSMSVHYLYDKTVEWWHNDGYFGEIAQAALSANAEKEGISFTDALRSRLAAIGSEVEKDVDWGEMTFVRTGSSLPTDMLLSNQFEFLNATELHFLVTADRKIKILPYHARGLFQWAPDPDVETALWVSPGSSASNAQRHMEAMLQEFESLVNSMNSTEQDMQRFLETAPILLRLLGYSDVLPQVVLELEGDEYGRDHLRPDFMVRPVKGELLDLVELKSPKDRISVGGPPRKRLSHKIIAAAQQLREYYEWFEDPTNRRKFQKRYGLRAYRPGMHLIIGNHQAWEQRELKRLTSQMKIPVKVSTYRELLQIGRERLLF
jgi:hypothetical protein